MQNKRHLHYEHPHSKMMRELISVYCENHATLKRLRWSRG
jgi:hypothetical protein